jgi:serine/threonine protein kinase
MHTRGIIHGDIKPENVFLARQEGEPRRKNVVKLLDFGLSFRESAAPDLKLGGTPPYLAPERIKGAPPSPSCDVYSLGVLMYEMLTGKAPYQGSLAALLDQTLEGPLPPVPSRLVEGLDSSIDALVMRAIERDPRKRHETAEAFHFEVRTVMSMSGLKVRRLLPVASSPPDVWTAIESALAAAKQGDLARVESILRQARHGDSIEALRTLAEGEAIEDDVIEDVE